MSLVEGTPTRDTILRRIGTATRDWGGDLLDAEGCLHLVNPSGPQTPVFWCFNAAGEFSQLAAALGPEQPLVGLRSLNRILDEALTLSSAAEQLAQHYADHLLARFGTQPCIIGGNCQAASVAYRVALRLLHAGVPVNRLVTLDAELRFPYPGHLRALFGRESLYNPINKTRDGSERAAPRPWDYSAASYDRATVDGAHGQYFHAENIASLAREILARPDLSGTVTGASVAVPGTGPVDWRISRIDPDSVTIEAPATDGPDDLALLPVWHQDDGAYFRIDSDDWVLPLGPAAHWTCRIPRPPRPGPWLLSPVICRRFFGPLDWPPDPDRRLTFC